MDQARQWLVEGIAQAKAGQRERARELLLRVVERDERNAQAWLWLSGVVDSDEDRRVALENVLTLDPQNATARAGLDWLDRQVAPQAAPAPQVAEARLVPVQPGGGEDSLEKVRGESAQAPARAEEPPTEPEGCPYCGQAVSASERQCPHCAQSLIIHTLKRPDFSARVAMLVVLWLVQAVTDLIVGVLIVVALMTVGTRLLSGLGVLYIRAYVAGAAFASRLPAADLERVALVLIVFDIVAAAWSSVVTVTLPWRRPAALAVALFVAAVHVVLAVCGFAVGVTSVWVMAAQLALALFLGFLTLESQGDFARESVRQRLEFDSGVKTSMDYYSRGRYYRGLGQTAKAILHWERAVSFAPDQFAFRVALGNANYALGRYDRAAEQLEAALRINPEAADVQEFLEAIRAHWAGCDSAPGQGKH